MDWFEGIQHTGLVFYVIPSGQKRTGLGDSNPLSWTSKFGSLVVTEYDGGVADGINEKGLVANVLFLDITRYGTRDITIPGLASSLWVQYYLDNFATVAEAVKATNDNAFQMLMLEAGTTGKFKSTLHLAITDSTGDNAVFEYIDGKVNIYHNKDYTILTNQPKYDEQLANLETYKKDNFKNLPSSLSSEDRFIRAYFYSQQLPKTTIYNEAVAGILSVANNVAKPFGIKNDSDNSKISQTFWTVILDQTNLRMLFVSKLNPFMIWIDLKKFNLAKGQPIQMFDYRKAQNVSGDISKMFTKTKIIPVLSPKQEDIDNQN